MKNIQLSHSRAGKYHQCPKRYYYHYVEKYREKAVKSSFLFGSAVDEALNALLLRKKKHLTAEEKQILEQDPFDLLKKELYHINHNKQDLTLPVPFMKFAKADFDASIIPDEALSDIFEANEEESLQDQAAAFFDWFHTSRETPTNDDRELYNKLLMLSLESKGKMILEAYEELILPQIEEVIAIQKHINLPNEEGDRIIGLIDFIARFKDDPENVYIVDNKTASKPYTDKDLDESEQLHLYAYCEELQHIAYVVMEKVIRKREPRVRINILKGKVDEEITDKVLDNFENVLLNIREEKFEKNLESGCNFYYSRCEYYDLCHNNKFNENKLVKL